MDFRNFFEKKFGWDCVGEVVFIVIVLCEF